MLKLSTISESVNLSKDITHTDAKKEPIHNWFPYLEGFSETFIENILNSLNDKPKVIYEPFSGSGTVPVYCKRNNIDCFYSEVNPFLIELTNLKLSIFDLSENEKKSIHDNLLQISNDLNKNLANTKPDKVLLKAYENVFQKSIYFEPENFDKVLRLSNYCKTIKDDNISQFLKIAICNSLLHSSLLKRAGDIRYRKGKELNSIANILELVVKRLEIIANDIVNLSEPKNNIHLEYNYNSKIYNKNYESKVDIIVTSPPYLNGTNYIRNTKLELWFLGYLKVKKDLSGFRKEVVTSGINDVTKLEKKIELPTIDNILNNPELWYDKRIPKMIKDYFFDMNVVISNFYKYLKKGGFVFLDIGDSVYAKKHIPTDLILLDLFKRNGFTVVDNLKLRDRRSKGGMIVKQCLLVLRK
jgi:DNA modification methylase